MENLMITEKHSITKVFRHVMNDDAFLCDNDAHVTVRKHRGYDGTNMNISSRYHL